MRIVRAVGAQRTAGAHQGSHRDGQKLTEFLPAAWID
jgi:hypothetical protein